MHAWPLHMSHVVWHAACVHAGRHMHGPLQMNHIVWDTACMQGPMLQLPGGRLVRIKSFFDEGGNQFVCKNFIVEDWGNNCFDQSSSLLSVDDVLVL